jgi:hypothetical protein
LPVFLVFAVLNAAAIAWCIYVVRVTTHQPMKDKVIDRGV